MNKLVLFVVLAAGITAFYIAFQTFGALIIVACLLFSLVYWLGRKSEGGK